MYKANIYFEIAGMAQDEQGNPKPVGMKVSIGESLKEIPYDTLTHNLNISAIAKTLSVKPEDVAIITPEEYEERYGDKE